MKIVLEIYLYTSRYRRHRSIYPRMDFFQIIGLILPVCHKVVTSSHVAIITALFVMYSSDDLLRFQSYSIYVFKSMLSNQSTLLSVTVAPQLRLAYWKLSES